MEDVIHYGVLSGTWEDKDETVLKIKTFTEKPSIEYAEENLKTEGKQKDNKYYSVFGQYILTPDVFAELDENIKTGQNTEKNGEIGLTSALASLINKEGLFGVVIDGQMFDIGNSKNYMKAMQCFSDINE
jgi:UTP-glucose-1-phosphate uridylyltransferase